MPVAFYRDDPKAASSFCPQCGLSGALAPPYDLFCFPDKNFQKLGSTLLGVCYLGLHVPVNAILHPLKSQMTGLTVDHKANIAALR